MKTIFLVSNSPGEVSTFVRPVVTELRRRHPDWQLQVCLVPCPYATGAEAEVIGTWPDAPRVWSPWQTTKAWWTAAGRGATGAVMFLGGDPWHALLLKSRFRLPALAYFHESSSWERSRWLGGFDALALGYEPPEQVADEATNSLRARLINGSRFAVGDLRVDALNARFLELSDQSDTRGDVPLVLALFPGSRWLHLKAVLGPFLRAVELTRAKAPEFEILLAASPFVSREQLADAAAKPLSLGLDTTTSELVDDTLVTERGVKVKIIWGKSHEVISRCHLALSLPGTNTAELAIAGKPTVVPLSERVPVGGGGLLGLLDRLPGFASLKRRLRHSKKNRVSFTAIPNQLAGRVVVPEFIVRDDLTDLADMLADLLLSVEKREAIGSEAQAVMGVAGASSRVVNVLETLL